MEKINNYAPVVVFTYCRLANTKETITSLLQNKEAALTDLIVYSDAAKNDKAIKGVEDTRTFLKTITGFKSVRIVERKANMGLAKSIVDGVTSVVNEYGSVIVLEDDMTVSPFFLKYMNEGLNRYKDRKDIASIHAYVYPIEAKELPDAFLIKGADCWGWATWQRAWSNFVFDAQYLYNEIICTKKAREFDFNYSYGYMRMLKGQIDGSSNSWAVCWYASAFLNNMYTLYPSHSYLQLNDIEGTGSTHGSTPIKYLTDICKNEMNWDKVEDSAENVIARKLFEQFFNSMKSWKRRCYDFIVNPFRK